MANPYDDDLARALERLDAERGRGLLALPGTETPVSSADIRQRADSPLAQPDMRSYSEIFGTGTETDRVRDFSGEEKAAKKEKTANMLKGLSLIFAGLADASEGLTLAGQKSHRGPSQVQALLANEQEERKMKAAEATQQRADVREDRIAKFQELAYQRQITEMILKNRQDAFDNIGKFLDYGDRVAEMTDPDVAKNTLKGVAKTYGVPVAEAWIDGLVANKDLAKQLGPAYQLLRQDPNAIGYLMNARRAMQGPDKGRQFFMEMLEQASRTALGEISRRAQRFKGDSFESFAKAMEEVNTHIAGALRGSVPMDAPTRQAITEVLTANGIQPPAVAAKEAETRSLERVKKGVEKEFEKKITEAPVRTALQAQGLDPDQATPKQIKAVTDRLDARKGTVAEYISYLRRPGATADEHAEADRLIAVEKELREAGAVKMPPQLPAAEVGKLSDLAGFIDMLDTLKTLHRPNYTGPAQGRWGGARAATIGLSKEETRFRATTQSLLNQLLNLRSGAAVTETEFERLQNELPTMNDPDETFLSKLDTSRDLLAGMLRRRKEFFREFGFKSESSGPLTILSITPVKK